MKPLFFILLLLCSVANASTLEVSVIVDLEEDATDVVFEYAGNILSQQLDIETEIVHVDINPVLEGHAHAKFLIESLFDYRVNNPDHYYSDITVLLTDRDLKLGTQDLAGYANIGSICSANSIAIIEITNNGLDGQSLAHEIAHVLGSGHDGEAPCENTSSRGYLMASSIHNGSDFLSQCSIDTINAHIEIYGGCLLEANVPPVIVVPPVVDIPQRRGGGGSFSLLFILLLTLTAWQNGHARDCKPRDTGSIPVVVSNGELSCGTKVRERSYTIRIEAP